MRIRSNLARKGASANALQRLSADERGLAALEFALIVGTLVVVMFNSVDVARFYFEQMEVENATQMASQSAWKACDNTHLPATVNCPGLMTAVNAAVQSTSLGTQVALQTASPTEGYYCVDTAGALQLVGDVNSKPADCGSVGSASDQPGDYLLVKTQYSYKPIFSGISVGGLLPAKITSTSLMRLK